MIESASTSTVTKYFCHQGLFSSEYRRSHRAGLGEMFLADFSLVRKRNSVDLTAALFFLDFSHLSRVNKVS